MKCVEVASIERETFDWLAAMLLENITLPASLPACIDANCTLYTPQLGQFTPLWLATASRNVPLVQLLLAEGADPSTSSMRLAVTPLHVAVRDQQVDMVRILLEAGADANVLDASQYSPLMCAASYHNPVCVGHLFNLLLSYNAQASHVPQVRDENGGLRPDNKHFGRSYVTYSALDVSSSPALHIAVQNPHLPAETVAILLDAGVDVDQRNAAGQTALMSACLDVHYDYQHYLPAHLELLLSRGADVSITDDRGWTCLHYAAQRGSVSAMKAMLEAGADVDMAATTGETPLWLLLMYSWFDGAAFLLRNGCDMHAGMRLADIAHFCSHPPDVHSEYVQPLEFAMHSRYADLLRLMQRADWHLTKSCCRQTQYLFNKTLSHTKTLAECCRYTIRTSLNRNICTKVKELKLPETITDFICIVDHNIR